MAGWLRELKENLPVGGDDGGGEGIVIHVVGTKSDIVALDPSRRRVPFERTIAYVAEQLYPTQASTPPATATATATPTTSTTSFIHRSSSTLFLQSPDSKRSSGFWGQDIGWDCCHEISAKDGEGIEEVFRVIARKLVEQRNRREAMRSSSLAMSGGIRLWNRNRGGGTREVVEEIPAAAMAEASSSRGVSRGGRDGNGSFRLGHGPGPGNGNGNGLGDSKRRSWLGISSSSVALDEFEDGQLEGSRRKGRCC